MDNLVITLLSGTEEVGMWSKETLLQSFYSQGEELWQGFRVIAVNAETIDREFRGSNDEEYSDTHTGNQRFSTEAGEQFDMYTKIPKGGNTSYDSRTRRLGFVDSYSTINPRISHKDEIRVRGQVRRKPRQPEVSYDYVPDTLSFLYGQFEQLQQAVVDYEKVRRVKHLPVIRPLRIVLANDERNYRLMASQLSDWRVTVIAMPKDAFVNEERLRYLLDEKYERMRQEFGIFPDNVPVVHSVHSSSP